MKTQKIISLSNLGFKFNVALSYPMTSTDTRNYSSSKGVNNLGPRQYVVLKLSRANVEQ